ncbi:MAG TPA: helix-turn-helix transcriptional regulator [Bacillota bacterium]|nr:helix-turn-helix transcriptional regulator [Bacillota bacterium]
MDTQQLGNNIAKYRKEKGMTQDKLAEIMSVSPQAVSKWENNISYPDIELLPKLADVFGISIDELFSKSTPPETELVRPEERKDPDKMLLKIRVNSKAGDKVRVNLPLALLKVIDFENMDNKDNVLNINGINLKSIDWNKVMSLIDRGVIGKLVEVESAEGDNVEVFVE